MNDILVRELVGKDLVINPSARCACILVLDTSGSMDGAAIRELNIGVQNFLEEVKDDELASYSVEIGIVTAGGRVQYQMPITPAHLIESVQKFVADGNTPLGEAVSSALSMLETRKNEYKKNGVPYYQPWMVIISDGEPTDDWQQAAKQAKNLAENKRLVVLALGVNNANMKILGEFSNKPAKMLAGLKFKEFFMWLSASMARVSCSASTSSSVKLPPTGSWDSI